MVKLTHQASSELGIAAADEEDEFTLADKKSFEFLHRQTKQRLMADSSTNKTAIRLANTLKHALVSKGVKQAKRSKHTVERNLQSRQTMSSKPSQVTNTEK